MRPEFAVILSLALAAICWSNESNIPSIAVAIIAIAVSLIAIKIASRPIALWIIYSLFFHVVIGMALGGYGLNYYDDLLHLVIVASLTFLVVNRVHQGIRWRDNALSRLQLVATGLIFAVGVGAFWEMFEYLIDLTGVYQSQLGLTDTMMDLFADGIGGIVACLYWHSSARLRPVCLQNFSDYPTS